MIMKTVPCSFVLHWMPWQSAAPQQRRWPRHHHIHQWRRRGVCARACVRACTRTCVYMRMRTCTRAHLCKSVFIRAGGEIKNEKTARGQWVDRSVSRHCRLVCTARPPPAQVQGVNMCASCLAARPAVLPSHEPTRVYTHVHTHTDEQVYTRLHYTHVYTTHMSTHGSIASDLWSMDLRAMGGRSEMVGEYGQEGYPKFWPDVS